MLSVWHGTRERNDLKHELILIVGWIFLYVLRLIFILQETEFSITMTTER